jgi:hypothetical protein
MENFASNSMYSELTYIGLLLVYLIRGGEFPV